MIHRMVTKDELLLRVERLKAQLSTPNEPEEREIIVRLISAPFDLADATYPELRRSGVYGNC
jgi:hypothetical protein